VWEEGKGTSQAKGTYGATLCNASQVERENGHVRGDDIGNTQHTATLAAHCNSLQPTAAHCNTSAVESGGLGGDDIGNTHLTLQQPTTAHGNICTLQHTAAHYSTLQHTAAHTKKPEGERGGVNGDDIWKAYFIETVPNQVAVTPGMLQCVAGYCGVLSVF